MTRPCRALTAGVVGLLCLGAARLQAANLQVGPRPQPVAGEAAERAVIDKYCVTCHNQKLKTGGLSLDVMDITKVGEGAEVWEKVVRKLRAGMMPPANRPRPDRAESDGLVTWLEAELDRAAARRPNPGRTEPFHRLNRVEYQNAIRDLLALDVDVTALLPSDDASYGFDNIAGVLKMSPTLMERYLSAARKISRMAVGGPVPAPSVDTFRVAEDVSQDDRLDGLPFGTRGGTRVRYRFPSDGEYVIQARLSRLGISGGATEDIPRFAESHDLEISVDGRRVALFTLAGETLAPGKREDAYQQHREHLDADWKVRLAVKAGEQDVTAAFVQKSAALNETQRLPFLRPYLGSGGDLRYQPYLDSLTISGPFGVSDSGDTPSRRRIFTCKGGNSNGASCARAVLAGLARRAYRRPVTEEDLKPLMAFYEDGRAEGGFERGVEIGLQRLLVSPSFLFRIERDPANVPPGTAYAISDVELASRLSFFLWSSIPDDRLLDIATQGKLRQPEVLEREVRRLLADPRAESLGDHFAGQWLFLRNLATMSPDLDAFPDFDAGLRQALKRETELFFESIVREDRNVLDLLTANYTFVNERLARHYGIPGVIGSQFRRIALTDDDRRGLLGKGSILAVTAYPHRTSPVLRGKWILENLLGTPPPPPPPNVPALKENGGSGPPQSMRQRMAEHRSNAVCASCHSMMDPPGFSLESFDAVGRQRTVDEAFKPIDASGVLPDGTTFTGVAGLRDALLKRPDRFVATLTEKLMIYGLGRGLEYYDQPAVRHVTREAGQQDYRFSALILGIVRSTPFQWRVKARE
jgi:hypothetical protein